MAKRIFYLCFIAIFVIVFLEILLRQTGTYMMRSEKFDGEFYSEFDRTFEDGHIMKHEANGTLSYDSDEFNISCSSNEYGFRGPSWSLAANDTITQVFFVGDSFIEGYGAGCGSTMPDHFADLFRSYNVKVYNGGIAGSDVHYAYNVIEKIICPLRPDVVLLGINSTDVHEYHKRGGFERFQEDGVTAFRKSPVNPDLYKKYQVYRFYTHSIRRLNWYTFIPRNQMEERNRLAENDMVKAIGRADSVCAVHNASLYVFFYPLPTRLEVGAGYSGLGRMSENCKEEGINSFTLVSEFQALMETADRPFSELYWPSDGHFNDDGYNVFAKLLAKTLDVYYPDWLTANKDLRKTLLSQ